MNISSKTILFVIGFVLLLCVNNLHGQTPENNKNGVDSLTILENARFAYISGDNNAAFNYYSTSLAKYSSISKNDWVRFRGAAILLGEKEANKVEVLFGKYGNPNWENEVFVNIDFAKGGFSAHRLDWNTNEFEEFGPIMHDGKLFIVSSRPNSNMDLGKYHLNQQAYYDVFWLDTNGQMKNANNYFNGFSSTSINSAFHDGPFSISNKNKRIILTRNAKTTNSQMGLGLFESVFDENKKSYSSWQRMKNLPTKFNHQHPFFDDNTNTLYFSSDMPGGMGGFDLYSMTLTDGKWSEPKNLGSKINTAGDEVFPTVYKEKFFFSSNGYKTTGNLDLLIFDNDEVRELEDFNSIWDDYHAYFVSDSTGYFCSNRVNGYGTDDIIAFTFKEFARTKKLNFILDHIVSDTVITEVTVRIGDLDTTIMVMGNNFNLEVLNSNGEIPVEISYKSEGFYPNKKSMKVDLKTVDEIHLNAEPLPLIKPPVLVIEIRESNGEIPVVFSAGTVSISLDGNQFITMTDTINNGITSRVLEEAKGKTFLWVKYQFKTQGYLILSDSVFLNITDLDTIYLNKFSPKLLALEKTKKGLDIGKYYKVGMIYFDVNKYNIRPDAAIELDKIIKALVENPEISIELGSHTDCRGSAKSNQTLSQNRAESSANYIIEKGNISKDRLTFKGYGETQILNKCIDGVKCTPEEHALNRRTEFKITNVVVD